MAVLCLFTNTPWPWPTPAGAASARGGVPHPWNGAISGVEGGVAQRRSAQVERGRLGCLLSRARDGVPQQAWFPCIRVKRRDRLGRFFRVDVAGRNRGGR